MTTPSDELVTTLNTLAALVEAVDVTSLTALIEGYIPTTIAAQDDRRNAYRIVLQTLFTKSLEHAAREEKEVFAASVIADLFSAEGQAQPQSLLELPTPTGLDGVEVMRMITEHKDGRPTESIVVVVDASAMPPAAWGIALHDVASHIADSLVEKGTIALAERPQTLTTIAEYFVLEHKKPTDTTQSYKPHLDS